MAKVLLFGDQTVDTLACIRSLVDKSGKSILLQKFLEDATKVVKRAVQSLDSATQNRFYGFIDLIDLARRFSTLGHPDDLVATVLMTISQLGELVLHCQLDASILNNPKALIVGLCTGVLAAAVCTLSRGIDDVLDLGIKAVSLSLQLARKFDRRSQAIEEGPGHWGFSVLKVPIKSLEQIIDKFHAEKNIPTHRRAYLSVVSSEGWATVSGPPSLLQELFVYSKVLEDAPKLRLPFGAAAHAPHLDPFEIDSLIVASGLRDEPIFSCSRLISTSKCQPYNATTSQELFRLAIEDIAQAQLRLSGTIQGVLAELDKSQQDVSLIPIGPLGHTSMVQRVLQQAGKHVDLVQLDQKKLKDSTEETPHPDHIAIIGMSGRFPGSENIAEFWQSLLDQKDFHGKIPASRFDLEAHLDPLGEAKNATRVPFGNFLKNPGLFDPRMFKVSPREALQMDPLQRLSLMCVYEALEMAGYSKNRTMSTESSRVATFFGQAADDYRDTNMNEGVDVYFVPATQRSFAPGKLNYHFGWSGPSYSVDSACASSLSAVLMGMTNLLTNKCDMALAGGGSLLSNPAVFAALDKGSFLSPTGSCKTFQDSADGYCRGEGVGWVVMKRLEDALADNDNILGVIRGAVRNSSPDSVSITHPSTTSQKHLYRTLLGQMNVTPEHIGYVEMHGTATQAGDMAEMSGIVSTFGHERPSDYPLYLGAVKANIGHGEASAGVSSLIKSIMMLKEHKIPGQPIPQDGPFVHNRNYPPIQGMGIRVAQNHQNFRSPKVGKRKILLNNFDAAGGNVSLILEEHSKVLGNGQPKPEDPRKYHVIAVSGHTAGALKANRSALLEYLSRHPEISLADLAYTTTARRMHHALRKTYIVESLTNLKEELSRDGDSPLEPKAKANTKIVFAFTGQGHKCRTMGAQLYQSSQNFRQSILLYHKLCESYGFDSFLGLIDGSLPSETVSTTAQTQLATIAVELALVALWKEYGIEPSHVIGHSLGEYAALCTAGVLSIDDTLFLVGTRAHLLQKHAERNTHAMLALNTSRDECVKIIQEFGFCEVACINSPTLTVISGPVDQIEALQTKMNGKGITATRLDMSYAFHSRQIEPILSDLVSRAKRVHFSKPRIPVSSTLKGTLVSEEGIFDAEYLGLQARKPVEYVEALHALRSHDEDNTIWIECGPHPVSLNFVKSTLNVPQSRLLPSLRSGKDDWKILCTTAAALHTKHQPISWSRFHHEYETDLRLLDLPAYAFELKDFWMPYKQHETTSISEIKATTSVASEKGIRSLLNSSIQSLQDENVSSTQSTFTFASFVSEPNLSKAMAGHGVNGHVICPASVFMDMAFSAARYVSQCLHPNRKIASLSIQNLEITRPLVLSGAEDHRVFVTATQLAASETSTKIVFSSQSGSKKQEHGQCVVQMVEPESLKSTWSKTSSIVKLAQKGLADAVDNYCLSKVIVYKLFSQMVQYGERYQAMQRVTVSNDFSQGFSSITLDAEPGNGNFMCSPYWLDAIVQLAGFQVNGNPAKPDSVLWVSTGFESMSLLQDRLKPGKTYTNFIWLSSPEEGNDIIKGDAYIFDGETTIGVLSGFEFHKMERSVFDALVRSTAGLAATTAPATRSIAPTAVSQKTVADSSAVHDITAALKPVVDAGVSVMSVADELETILSTIAKQTGIDRSEIDDNTVFADLGVDSLMSITISDVLLKDFNMTLPSAFLQEHNSVAEVREALGQPEDEDEDEEETSKNNFSSSSDEEIEGYETPYTPYEIVSHVNFDTKDIIIESVEPVPEDEPEIDLSAYKSKAVLIHGRKRSKETPLFLITDGGGSAAAYLHLPSLPKGRPVYALESPFLHDPTAFRCTVEEVGEMYYASLRAIQPQGPYLLGGWSAGAVFSYEVSNRLLDAGETILGLIMIDMRVPTPLPYHPELTMEIMEASGITAGINRGQKSGGGSIMAPIPMRLKQHLLSVCHSLVKYDPKPMTSRIPGKVFMIWARLGLSEIMEDKRPDEVVIMDENTRSWFYGSGKDDDERIMVDASAGMMGWFYSKRTTFGSNGWEKFVGQELTTYVVDADHFSMMTMPSAVTTGGYIKEAVELACK